MHSKRSRHSSSGRLAGRGPGTARGGRPRYHTARRSSQTFELHLASHLVATLLTTCIMVSSATFWTASAPGSESLQVASRRAMARAKADSNRAAAFAHKQARDECRRAAEAAERAGVHVKASDMCCGAQPWCGCSSFSHGALCFAALLPRA